MDAKFELSLLGQIVWEDRYALKDENGNRIEDSILDTFKRVAKAIASKEKDPKKWEKKFYEIMANRYYCPAGRILAHAGTHYSQLLNCFVLPFEDDSLESIMETAKNMAITQKFGGGCGFNYSTLRPSGSHIKGVNGHSCGVIGFINMMSTISEVIEQGGCLTDDSLINTAKGLLYLREIVKEKEQEQGWYDHSIGVKTKDGDFQSRRYYVNGYSDIIRLRTDCGIELRGTPSHKLYVMSAEGPVWKEFNEIQRGDWVISNLNQHDGCVQSLITDFQKKHHNCIVPDRLPSTIDEEFAFFLGYFLGNGFSTVKEGDHRIGVTIPDKSHLVNRIKGIYGNLFGENIGVTVLKKPGDKSRTYYVSNRIIKEYLSVNGLLKHRSPFATIPLKIRQSPPDIVAVYIAGLFESDGALCHGYPMMSTTSKVLATELQTLLFGLGIPCSLSNVKRGLNAFSKTPMYKVCVVSPAGLKIWNEIIPVDPLSRFQACSSHETRYGKQRWFVLPHGEFWLKKALDYLPKYKQNSGLGNLRKQLTRYIRGDRALTLSAYNEFMNNPAIRDNLPLVGNSFYSKVMDKNFEEDFTYDLEVDESHSYMANTLISHNSRRGANLGLLEVWHPDVWDFISFKTDHNWDHLREFVDVIDEEKWAGFKFENNYKLQMYNISIGVSDEFFEALKKNEVWPFMWKDKEWELYTVQFRKMRQGTYTDIKFEVTADSDKTAIWKVKKKVPYPTAQDTFEILSKRKIKASEIWEKICYNAWADGCPGLINLSTARKFHNLEYIHPLLSTNPCITGETLVAVADGRVAIPIKQLAEEGKDVPVYCRNDEKKRVSIRMMRNPRITGYNQKILKVIIENGHSLRVSEFHKFVLSDGSIVMAKDLKYGDSFSIMTRLQAPFDFVIKKSNSKSQDYYWINSTDKKTWIPDHRMIFNFNNKGNNIGWEKVIHHRDYNGLNNAISNFDLQSKKQHDKFHSVDKMGDKNPMRRAQTEWSKEKWQEYRDNMSDAISGELNGRFSGISNDDLFNKAIEMSKKYGMRLTTDEWENQAIKIGYPTQFSEYRMKTFGTVMEFLSKAATVAGVQGSDLDAFGLREFKRYLRVQKETDLDVFFENGVIKVNKICEGCQKKFVVRYMQREQCFCSNPCFTRHYVMTPTGRSNLLQAKEELREKKRIQQINAFNDLKIKLGHIPMKKEFAPYCKEKGIPFRLPVKREVASGKLVGTFHSWRELEETALQHNHRVLSVAEDGIETVFNGTVDEFHNFYIGHFEEDIEGHKKFIYVNNRQCGEQFLPKNSSCNLSSLVLPSFVKKTDNEESSANSIDWDALKNTIWTAVRFADNVIDICEFPLEDVKKKALLERRIGLGTMGVHDMLIALKLDYDSEQGRLIVDQVLRFIRDEAYKASIELAKEKGSFPVFDKEKFLDSKFIKTLPSDIQEGISKFLLRNSSLTTQAPTGTTGTMYNASTGCEPWFAMSFQRNTRLGSYEDGCSAYLTWKSLHPDEPKPSYFKTAQEISPEDHIKMMILFSKYVDNAVSKTVNMPEHATVEDVQKAFIYAMENGVKGITIFREGSKEGVLVNKKSSKAEVITEAKKIVQDLQNVKPDDDDSRIAPRKRGNRVPGATTRVSMQKHHLYVTVNKNKNGEVIEVFATVGENKELIGENNVFHTSGVEDSWAEALGKMISLAFRAGVKPSSIIRNLKNIPSDKPVFQTIGDCETSEPIPSPPHAIARVIEEELKYSYPVQHRTNAEKKGGNCQECGSTNINWKSPTCYECKDCSFSGCG